MLLAANRTQRIKDHLQLMKMRLSFVVVFSSAVSYLWASNRHVNIKTIWLLSIGGFCITAAANTFNQIIERDTDGLMKRTANRPLPSHRISPQEAMIAGGIYGIAGVILLSYINALSGCLAVCAFLCYAGIYTPLKRTTTLTIIPGAISGSIPILIGCVAASGHLTASAWLLFLVQFIWQFPHTWTIAWLLRDDYSNAGIKMLPLDNDSRTTSILLLLSTFLIVPASVLLYVYNCSGPVVCILSTLSGLGLTYFAYRHYNHRSRRTAVNLMLGLLTYLPFVLIILVIEKFS